ncbi:hypothetical protein [Streptomyces sp. NRRL F-5126]|uniref:hypothetical protein n=1 Tax=Streptomyces sp. NRRL F-5126 TaxID=1463857 RepID=UPI00068BCD21|nr:hypothetical protein [Streptomyces sp. NRRL F-5126]
MTHGGQGDERVAPGGEQPWAQPWHASGDDPNGPQQGQSGGQGRHGRHAQPSYGDAAGGEPYGGGGQSFQGRLYESPSYPQESDASDPSQLSQASYGYGVAQPLPAESPAPGSADATRFLPPVPGAGVPMPPGGDSAATQFIPPFPQQDPTAHQPIPQPGFPQPEPQQPGPQHPDAQATQFIAPVPPQDPHTPPPGGAYGAAPGGEEPPRQPPAEFDNLFRNGNGGPASGGRIGQARQVSLAAPQNTDATQHLPQFDGYDSAGVQPPAHQQSSGYGYPQPPAYQQTSGYGYPQPSGYDTPPPGGQGGYQGDFRDGGGSRPGRKKSPAILIGAGVAVVAVVGFGVGALLSGGGGDGKKGDATVAADSSASAGDGKSAPADPAQPQAKALDQLLADSNDSREAVIGAVGDIKTCKNLDGAASDLHDAAKQRRGLADRLDKLAIDKLPNHDQLASALKAGWKASAAADDHYATWGQQAKSHKVCKHGSARRTSAEAQGDRSSGEATTAKKRAAKLWNAIATKYGLKQRSAADL